MSLLPASTLTALLAVRATRAPLEEVLQHLVEIARDALDGADEASTTLVRRGTAFTASSTGQLALDADEVQYEHGRGPCIEAGESGTVLLVEDVRREARWPDYAADVVPRGVLSSLSVPLPLQTDVVGALNCYSRTPSAFPGAQVDVAVQLSGHIGAAVASAVEHHDTTRTLDDMKAAMLSRAVIEQAKGIVMAQNRCDADAAFTILSRASQARNAKLRDLAREIVDRVSDPSGPPHRSPRSLTRWVVG